MKLLLDENLSHRILAGISDLYPDSSHVKEHNLLKTDDERIWNFAAENGFVILSKDSDFHQRSLLRGAPPKFIYLKLGNCSTKQMVEVLRNEYRIISDFGRKRTETTLILM